MERPSAGIPIVEVTPDGSAVGVADEDGEPAGPTVPDAPDVPVGADALDGAPDDPPDETGEPEPEPDGPPDAVAVPLADGAPEPTSEVGAPADAAAPIDEAGDWVAELPHAPTRTVVARSAARAAANRWGMGGTDSVRWGRRGVVGLRHGIQVRASVPSDRNLPERLLGSAASA